MTDDDADLLERCKKLGEEIKARALNASLYGVDAPLPLLGTLSIPDAAALEKSIVAAIAQASGRSEDVLSVSNVRLEGGTISFVLTGPSDMILELEDT